MVNVIETFDAKETFALGEKIGKEVQPGDIFCLEGDLGVGKTVFTQGFAKGIGITEPVNSPTFTIVQEYKEGRIPLYHFDLYRLENVGIKTITDELREYSTGRKITFVEWAEFSQGELPFERIEINVTYDDDDSRIYEFKSVGERNQKVIEGLGVICSSTGKEKN